MLGSRRRVTAHPQLGIAYVDTLIALTLLALALLPLFNALVLGLRSADRAGQRFTAVNVLRSEAETLKAEVVGRHDLSFLAEGTSGKTVTVDDEEFLVERSVTKPGPYGGKVARVDLTIRSASGDTVGQTTFYLYERGR